MQNSRWFAKFPHPICATVLQKERPTPPPTLKKPAKTAPLPSKTQFQPNKSRPLPDKARHLPSKTQTCPNCHTKHITIAHTHAPPLCHTSAGTGGRTPCCPIALCNAHVCQKTTHTKPPNHAQQQERCLQLCFANSQPKGMKKAPRKLLVRLTCCLVEQVPCLVIC